MMATAAAIKNASSIHVSGKQTVNVDRCGLMRSLTLVLSANLDSSDVPEVITRILAWTIDEEVILFIHQVLTMELGHLKIGRQLDRIRGTSFLTEPTEDATREVDAEELWVAPPVLIFSGLQGNTADRAGDGAQVACHASLAAVWITRKNDSAPIPWG